jgi:hypothetical protein
MEQEQEGRDRPGGVPQWVKTYWPGCTVAVGFVACLLLPVLLGLDDYFMDELYYLACAARPALGYVDHPPLAPLLLGGVRALLGDSLLALRLLPAACGVATILLTARLTRIWGSGAHGQLLASLAVACAPMLLIMSGFFSPNAIELLLWTACWSALVEISRRDRMRDWLLLGALLGLGFENKHTAVTLAVAISFGLLVARGPKLLRQPGPWAGLALALALALPNLLFQLQHDWPSLEFYRIATFTKNISTPPLEGLIAQAMAMNVATLPLWTAGLGFLCFSRHGARDRAIGWACAALLLAMLLSQWSRPDRIMGIYPALFAAGAAWLDTGSGRVAAASRWALTLAILAVGLALLPLAVPVLPTEPLASYTRNLQPPPTEKDEGRPSPLPQWLAGRLGWRETAREVDRILREDLDVPRSEVAILAPSYGHAGALELHGHALELPVVYSTHNSYHLWGPPDQAKRVWIVLGFEAEVLRGWFESVERASTIDCEYCNGWRDDLPVWIARGPKVTWRELWPDLGYYGNSNRWGRAPD